MKYCNRIATRITMGLSLLLLVSIFWMPASGALAKQEESNIKVPQLQEEQSVAPQPSVEKDSRLDSIRDKTNPATRDRDDPPPVAGSIRIDDRNQPNRVVIDRNYPERVIIDPPNNLRVRVWTDKRNYEEGEKIRIYFWANEDAYIYIYNTDTRGITRQIFPNYYDQDQYIRGGRVYSIPDRGYNLTVTGPEGREYLEAVAVAHRRDIHIPRHRWDRNDPFPRYSGGGDQLQRELDKSVPQSYGGSPSALRDDDVRPEIGGDIRITPRRVVVGPPERPAPYYVTARDTTWFRVEEPLLRYSYGFLEVETTPGDARVYIDNYYVGLSDVRVRLSVGRHTVRIERSGYESETRSVYIRSRQTSTLRLRLNSYRRYPPYRYEEESSDWNFRFHIRF